MSVSSTKFSVCLVCEGSNRAVLLPRNITYTQLVEHVKKKFKIDDSYDICFYYKISSDWICVIDDDDVDFFANEVWESKARLPNLFIKKTVQELKVDPCSSKSLDSDLSIFPGDFEVDMPNPSKKET